MPIYVDGARRLRSTLKAAGHDLDDLKAANRAAAETVKAAAITFAPQITGALRSTIRASGTARAGVVRAGRKKVPYAGIVHYGDPHRNHRENPFIYNAAKSTEPVWVEQYNQELLSALAKVKGK